MNIQEAAFQILKKENGPLSSKIIAKLALEQKLVVSISRTPTYSMAQTLEKNIRENIYNTPKLDFIYYERRKRLIGLPSWNKTGQPVRKENYQISLQLPLKIMNKIRFMIDEKMIRTQEEAIILVLNRGLTDIIEEHKNKLTRRLDRLEKLSSS